jgi:SAM-dependent methyltransferase
VVTSPSNILIPPLFKDVFKQQVQAYFDQIAPDLDRWSDRNRYYYQDLERLHQFLVPAGSNVLEIGCGTGSLLAAVAPQLGVGIDFSQPVLEIARRKYPQFQFHCLDAETLAPTDLSPELVPFDVILLSGVLGYLSDIQSVLERLKPFCHSRTRLVLSFHNFLWEPLLHLAERIGQRRRQPQQNWLSMIDILNLLAITGYTCVRSGRRLLIPKRIPGLSGCLNRYLSQLPGFNHLGLTNYVVARLSPQLQPDSPTQYTCSVIIPARNEAGNIAAAIARLPQLGKQTEVIFVEGNSQDQTWAEIQRLVQTYQGQFTVKALQQSGQGKADAVRLGFAQATGDILIILDADLTVQPEDLSHFFTVIALGRGEFVNGSRLVYPRSAEAMPWLNTLANKFFALAFSFLLGQSLKDTLCGTKVLWKADYKRIAAGRSYFGDFDPFGDFDLLFGATKLNLHIVEVPVRYQPRGYGESNISHLREGLMLLRMCLYASRKIKFV